MNDVSVSGPLPSTRAVPLIMRGVYIEMVRRREFYVLLLLMALFVFGVIVVNLVGIENAATATFLLNLGMSFSCIAVHILVLLTAARQLPSEMETRSLYPLLAKPLLRSQYILGKWLAVAATGFAVLILLLLCAWIPVPKLQSYNSTLLEQMVVLQGVSLAMIAALALLFSLFLPKGVNIALTVLLYLGGDRIAGLIRSQAGKHGFVNWISYYIPNFADLNLVTRYTDGVSAVPNGEFFQLLLYGVLCTIVALSLAMVIFQRRPL